MNRTGQPSISVILASVCLTFSFLCCTVRNDRDVCPSAVELDFSRYPGQKFVLLCDNGNEVQGELVDITSGDGAVVSRVYEGKLLKISVLYPFENVDDVPLGYRPEYSCAPLMAWSACFVRETDPCRLEVKLHKEHCRLTISAKGEENRGLVLRSRVDAYLPGGELSPGEYSERVTSDEDGLFRVNVLRQKDSSLMLDVVEDVSSQGKVLRSIALGLLMEKAGYDWKKEDLDDLDLSIGLVTRELTLTTVDWTKTFDFRFVF